MGAMDLTLAFIRAFAFGAHAAIGQLYNGGPYSGHLEDVVAILREFNFDGRVIQVAYLHDIREDTKVTSDDLKALSVGVLVIRAVEFVTDEPGHNRKTRKLNTYARVREEIDRHSDMGWLRDGVLVKLADRVANLRSSHKGNPGLLKMYRKEAADFRDAYKLPEYVYASDPRWERLLAEYDRLVA